MAFKIMTVPLPETQDRDLDVNAFMAAHTVVSVQRRVVTTSEEAYVVFMIEYVPSPQEHARSYASAEKPERKDWRAALSDDDFRVFNLLREERAKIADEYAFACARPVGGVCTRVSGTMRRRCAPPISACGSWRRYRAECSGGLAPRKPCYSGGLSRRSGPLAACAGGKVTSF